MLDNQEVRQRVAKAEQLLSEVDSFPDPRSQAITLEIVQTLLDLYGEGLARIVKQTVNLAGTHALNALVEDELLNHLLLLHDLHPQTIEARVQIALDSVRPYMESHGGSVELLGIEEGVAHLRLLGSCHGCPSSTLTLQTRVEEAIRQVAPELLAIETEGIEPVAALNTSTFIPVSALLEHEVYG